VLGFAAAAALLLGGVVAAEVETQSANTDVWTPLTAHWPPEKPPTEAASKSRGDSRAEFRTRLAEMVDAVETWHVDDAIEPERLVEGAIRGMLDTLDPHSHFLSREAYRAMRETQDGSFYGLGIIIAVRRDSAGKSRLTVVSPIDGMPAKRLGVRSGDIIAAIDGEATDGLSLDEAVSKLRGAKATSVTVTIEREAEKFDLVVERAEIPTESVPHAYMIRPDTGFIRIKDFTKTTTSELHAAISRLSAQGMKKLVLDLRDNPGGLLDEAITVAGTFLEPGQLVVETRGRIPGSTESRRAPRSDLRLPADVPVIVLVNNGSASASEIVAGAIQDHDRGLVVGELTWGKGLVQSIYTLSEDCGLALTTARYYTPSGRQIQRDYRTSYADYTQGPHDAPQGEEHETDGGRKVYSGGGIEPDEVVVQQEALPLVRRLVNRSLFFRHAGKHAARHAGEVDASFQLSPKELAEFRAFAEAEKVSASEEEWLASQEQVRLQLLQEILNAHLGLEEGFKALNEGDPQVQAALQLWDRAAKSAMLGGKIPGVATTSPPPG
jgi:carboxyl-terminal processing protease